MEWTQEKKTIFLFPMRLQFYADGGGADKTEEATPKKLTDARKEGQVARSQELSTAVMLLAFFVTVKVFVGFIGESFLGGFKDVYQSIDVYTSDEFGPATATAFIQDGLLDVMWICLPVFAVAVVAAFVVTVAQVKWKVTAKPLKPKFSKFSPINGFKRMFSKDKLFELIKDVVKIALIFYVAYSDLKDAADSVVILYDLSLYQAVLFIGDFVIGLGIKLSAIYLIVGAADYIYQKLKFKRDMRMSKQEVKDEYKQQEGDPKVKGKIRQKMQEASRRRMMQDLPTADVVITNPTHYAVAIKYDPEVAEAPIVLAKGSDYLAAKIKEVAKENHIEIVENKPLARMLYANVDIGQTVPPELYQAVAEVLAFVYKVQGKI